MRARLDSEAPAGLVVERDDLAAHLRPLGDRAGRPWHAQLARRRRRARSPATPRRRRRSPSSRRPRRGDRRTRGRSAGCRRRGRRSCGAARRARCSHRTSRSPGQRTRASGAPPRCALRLGRTIMGGDMRAGTARRRATAILVGLTALALTVSGCAPDSSVAIDTPPQVDAQLPEETRAQLEASVTHAMAATGASGAIVGVWVPWSGTWVAGVGTESATDSDARRRRHGLPRRRCDATDDLRRALRPRGRRGGGPRRQRLRIRHRRAGPRVDHAPPALRRHVRPR